MQRVMIKITGVILVVLSTCLPILTQTASAITNSNSDHSTSGSPLIITALQTGSTKSASEEFISLTNIATTTISIDAVKLEYFSASTTDFIRPARTILLKGVVAPNETIIVGSTGYRTTEARAGYSATLASAGGHLRLMSGAIQWDLLGWGTAQKPQGRAAVAPAAGQVLTRKQSSGVWQQTGNNAQDFEVAHTDLLNSGQTERAVAAVKISEVFPDPETPGTDAEGEFIELYNTSDVSFNLEGLVMLAGMTSQKKFIVPSTQMAPHSFVAFFAPQTKLSLGNNGSRVVLQSGSIILDEATYPKALPSKSWAWTGTDWRWTERPTPNELNIITDNSSNAAVRSVSNKKTSTKKATTKKAKISKTSPKGVVEAAATTTSRVTTTTTRPPVHNAVVAGVGGVAVLYGAYEYRYDALNIIRKLRRNRSDR